MTLRTPLTDESICPFGKHKGKKLGNVPASDLLYMWENYKLYGDFKQYIEDNLDVIKSQIAFENKKRK